MTSLPVLSSLRGYRRAWLRRDALAGLALLVIAVPEQFATSRLAGMPPLTGLYAFIAGSVMFALLGSNPQMSVGADSTIAPLFAVGVAHLASTGSPRYVALVGLLAVIVGLLVSLVGILRLGWIADLLSAPIITGFLAGVAVIIVVHQLPDLLGLPATGGSTLHRISAVLHHLPTTNGWTLGIGIAVILSIAASHRVHRRAPGALFGLIGSTVFVTVFGLSEHGVAVLGTIAHRAPSFGLSELSWSAVANILPVAAVVALVVIIQSAATTRAFSDRQGYEANVGRDFLGVGAGSVLAGVAGSFAVNASPPRTAAVSAAGGRTQLAGLVAAAVVAMLVPAGALLQNMPLATLAAVLIFIAIRIFHLRDLAAVLRFDVWEFGLAVVTLLTVALIGVKQGVVVAVGLAILDRTRLNARPQAHIMARIPGTTSWEPLESDRRPIEVPGVLVILFAAPLYFANADHFRAQITSALSHLPNRPHALVLDVVGMHDIDFTGVRALRDLLDELDRQRVAFAVARPGRHLIENLARSGLLKRIGTNHLYSSVDEAVRGVPPRMGT
ncbi:MAG: SulP family inorganic anion transporter [Solirubrobacteraceae bacterium]